MCFFFFFKQKTAYEMRISDWSSDVYSSDLDAVVPQPERVREEDARQAAAADRKHVVEVAADQLARGGPRRDNRIVEIGGMADQIEIIGVGIGWASCRG